MVVFVSASFPNLAPLAGRGRILREAKNPGEGTLRESCYAERPPHPNPLPASGARERSGACGDTHAEILRP